MTEAELFQYAATQGVSFVFAIVVLFMIRDMITKLNQNYCRITEALIKLAERNGKNEVKPSDGS